MCARYPGSSSGFVGSVPSPDGRRLLFWDKVEGVGWHSLLVAHSDGSERRRLAEDLGGFALVADWSPDSGRIAYGDSAEVRVVGIDGRNGRRVGSGPAYAVAWSPTGKLIAYCSDDLFLVRPNGQGRRKVSDNCDDLAWSPNGRLLAVSGGGLEVLDVSTGRVEAVTGVNPNALAWSPNGRLLASASPDGIRIHDLAGAGESSRRLTTDQRGGRSPGIAWSRDGSSIAYVRIAGGLYTVEDLRVVDLLGRARTVVPGGGALGGQFSGVAWTRPGTGSRFRRPGARLLATAISGGIEARWPIASIATDGERIAYVACAHVFVWTPASGRVEQAEASASLAPRCNFVGVLRGVYSLAIAGERVAFGLIGGGNTTFWWLGGASTAPPRSAFTLGEGRSTTGLRGRTSSPTLQAPGSCWSSARPIRAG